MGSRERALHFPTRLYRGVSKAAIGRGNRVMGLQKTVSSGVEEGFYTLPWGAERFPLVFLLISVILTLH